VTVADPPVTPVAVVVNGELVSVPGETLTILSSDEVNLISSIITLQFTMVTVSVTPDPIVTLAVEGFREIVQIGLGTGVGVRPTGVGVGVRPTGVGVCPTGVGVLPLGVGVRGAGVGV
jgi:hypothetical protein